MINLLPEKEKKELGFEEKRKIILVLGVLCLIFLISLILFLYLFKIYLVSQINFQKDLLFEKEKELKSFSQFQDFKQIVKEINQKLVKVRNFYKNQVSITPISEELSGLVPPTIYFTRFFIQKPGASEEPSDYLFKITIWGYAPSREDLFLFQKALREDDKFKEVNVSLTSWLELSDVDFQLTFKIK
ncbi:hypothetical protein COX73_00435 [bacterium (Candidatus Gribaldobacteria) CG_4_10_14_0_2_um_filter_36_18]|uniref:Tfp pilus assembly protein PilN n=1 Tax=bacterium (Candidatus Gribaldobacteria) CG_4_10_14_0_2_um_filter_36_18 TaxID=2014264 RepID=A0A2M7VL39_9BACT|nr:MAG: hypothetical protein COX73_00435 [bacterium (Candidatus Gribaldobacteria) CG_4_10_14_0_2_um_filter_36_18]